VRVGTAGDGAQLQPLTFLGESIFEVGISNGYGALLDTDTD